jgi:hypothetical protein
MRLSSSLKACLCVLALSVPVLSLAGCAPEASTANQRRPSAASREQAGSAETPHAETATPPEAPEQSDEAKPEATKNTDQ